MAHNIDPASSKRAVRGRKSQTKGSQLTVEWRRGVSRSQRPSFRLESKDGRALEVDLGVFGQVYVSGAAPSGGFIDEKVKVALNADDLAGLFAKLDSGTDARRAKEEVHAHIARAKNQSIDHLVPGHGKARSFAALHRMAMDQARARKEERSELATELRRKRKKSKVFRNTLGVSNELPKPPPSSKAGAVPTFDSVSIQCVIPATERIMSDSPRGRVFVRFEDINRKPREFPIFPKRGEKESDYEARVLAVVDEFRDRGWRLIDFMRLDYAGVYRPAALSRQPREVPAGQ